MQSRNNYWDQLPMVFAKSEEWTDGWLIDKMKMDACGEMRLSAKMPSSRCLERETKSETECYFNTSYTFRIAVNYQIIGLYTLYTYSVYAVQWPNAPVANAFCRTAKERWIVVSVDACRAFYWRKNRQKRMKTIKSSMDNQNMDMLIWR